MAQHRWLIDDAVASEFLASSEDLVKTFDHTIHV